MERRSVRSATALLWGSSRLAAKFPAAQNRRFPGNRPAPIVARILIVDDNVDAAKTLEMLLQDPGHETKVCNDGAACLKEAAVFRPHVVLLDVGLPSINGYEVARAIRALPFGKTVLIIAITAYGDTADRVRRAKQSGIDHYMVKPADIDRLKALILGHPMEHE